MEHLFQNEMSVETVKQLAERIPDFVTKYAPRNISNAIIAANKPVVDTLLKMGIKFDVSTGNRALQSALLLRDSDTIALLISAGADPYGGGGMESAIAMALQLKSAKFLRLLDRDGKYGEQLKQLEQNYTPPKNSPFVGSWAWLPPSGGFGSLSAQFYDDGSAFLFTDAGGGSGLWKQDGKRVLVTLNSRNTSAKETKIEFELVDEGLLILPPDGNIQSNRRILKSGIKIQAEAFKTRSHPKFVRLQAACISGGTLYLQINGRYLAVPIVDLVSGAKESNYSNEPVVKNIIEWDKFENITIPTAITTTAKSIPFMLKPVSPSYSQNWDKLAYSQDSLATLAENNDWTLFPMSSGERYHAPDSGKYGEELWGFALMSSIPFDHGKDWVFIFFRRANKE